MKSLTDWTAATLFLLTLFTSGCVSVRYDDSSTLESSALNADLENRIAELQAALVALGPNVDPREAGLVADIAVRYPMELAKKYKLTKPAITHNMLVNVGIKPRGLCIHWTEDMLVKLTDLNLSSLDLHWGVAYPPHLLRLEHSTPVITPTTGQFEEGVILDGWRDSGTLFWCKVKEDTRYKWEKLPNTITEPPEEGV